MAVAYIQEFTLQTPDDRTTVMYDAVAAELDVEHNWPDGLIVHTVGFDEEDGVFRIFDVWESESQAHAWMEAVLQPAVQSQMEAAGVDPEAMGGPSRDGFYALHDVEVP
jgi:hypothetical protein